MEDLAVLQPSGAPAVASDRYRPALHFTPQRNWMNDPNGLVYFAGEYHLFYQYNPYGDQWGRISWGHAVSHDLITWKELPVAIPETDGKMIFSGSIVVDWQNTSGLQRGDEPALLAFYTEFDAEADIQRQCLAYSHDRGRTFDFYSDNPIIDLDMAHFRDPKVFYHAASCAWVMVVALAREHKIQFYRSTNLRDWTLAGEFGPAGATTGQWECPDLMIVPLDTDPGRTRWVLKVDVDAGFIGGGSGAQYFVGDFDGSSFTVDPSGSAQGETVDFGPDFYAAVTWSDLPPEQPGPLWLGWMSNHQTGRFYPTSPWRGAQSFPRTLFLFEKDGRLRLGQRPVLHAIEQFERASQRLSNDGRVSIMAGPSRDSFRASVDLTLTDGQSETLQLVAGNQMLLTLSYDQEQGLTFTREDHGAAPGVSLAFESKAPYAAGHQILGELFVDGCLAELFVDGGRRVFTCCVFPTKPGTIDVRLRPIILDPNSSTPPRVRSDVERVAGLGGHIGMANARDGS